MTVMFEFMGTFRESKLAQGPINLEDEEEEEEPLKKKVNDQL